MSCRVLRKTMTTKSLRHQVLELPLRGWSLSGTAGMEEVLLTPDSLSQELHFIFTDKALRRLPVAPPQQGFTRKLQEPGEPGPLRTRRPQEPPEV